MLEPVKNIRPLEQTIIKRGEERRGEEIEERRQYVLKIIFCGLWGISTYFYWPTSLTFLNKPFSIEGEKMCSYSTHTYSYVFLPISGFSSVTPSTNNSFHLVLFLFVLGLHLNFIEASVFCPQNRKT